MYRIPVLRLLACFALFLLFAGQGVSFASSLDAYIYVGTSAAPKTLYIESGVKGNSIVDPNAWMYVTNGNWYFLSAWFDSFQVTTVNGITTTTGTVEGYVDDTIPALLTYTWTSFRSVNTLKIKLTDFYTGAVLNGVNTFATPYTSLTGFFVIK